MTDLNVVGQWLDLVYPDDGTAEQLYVSASTPDGYWRQTAYRRADVPQGVALAELGAPQGTYLSACSFTPGTDRKAENVHRLFGIWSDVDIAGPGHRHDPVKAEGRPLPPDEHAAARIVVESGLPGPTAWVHSGGGLYAWWLLGGPALASGLGDLTASWQKILGESAKRLGYHYGTGVGDLARVLRVPGTINRKAGLARPCRLDYAAGPRYTLGELREAAEALKPTEPARPSRPSRSARQTSADPFSDPAPADGLTPSAVFAAATEWRDILEPHGWTEVYTRGDVTHWRHPAATHPTSATTNHGGTDRLTCFSDNAGLPTEGTHSKSFVWAALRQGTPNPDMSRAGLELAALGYGTRGPSRSTVGDTATPGPASSTVAIPAEPSGLAVQGGDAWLSEDPLTDSHLADRFWREQLGGRCVWAEGLGWLQWDGKRWVRCAVEEVIERCRRWVLGKYEWALSKSSTAAGAGDIPTADRFTDIAKSWRKIADLNRLKAVTTLAKGVALVAADRFDAHPELLNVGNGVVDLQTGELLAHDPKLGLTKLTPVDYVPDATHPAWTQALTALDPDVAEWMRLRLGQAATGHPPDDDLVIIARGSGQNGKSTIYGGAQRALGDYAVLISDRVLLGDPGNHPTELMSLRGARFALIEETPEERRLDTQRLKKITGTDRVTARYIYGNDITFYLTHSLHVTSNFRPAVSTTDHGTWRRLALVDFAKTFPQSGLREQVRHDPEVHRAVLAWHVSGAVDWFKAGCRLPPQPTRVVADTERWRADTDLILGFWLGELTPDPTAHAITSDMYECFTAYLRRMGHPLWAAALFTERFRDHQRTREHQVTWSRPKVAPTTTLHRWSEPVGAGGLFPARMPVKPLPARPAIWAGVRFASPGDGHGL